MIEIGGVKFDKEKIKELIVSHAKQNTEAARLLRSQQIELQRVQGLLEKCESHLELILEELHPPSALYKFTKDLLDKVRGGK